MTAEHVRRLLYMITGNCFFINNKTIFKQIKGLPMGNPLSGLLAILFMDSLERSVISQLSNNISCYSRYIDDIFLLTNNKETANAIQTEFNNAHPAMKFTLELPNTDVDGTKSLNLLDVKLSLAKISNSIHLSTEFYKKPQKAAIFVHSKSAISDQSKFSAIRNERQRIKSRCTNETTNKRHQNNFDCTLRTMGYSEDTITKTKHLTIQQNTRNSEQKLFYLRLPFTNSKTNNAIRSIIRRSTLPIALAQKSYTIRQFLSTKSKRNNDGNNNSTNIPCRLIGCTIRRPICLETGVVYLLSCNKCRATYIGSTIRTFHTRFKEHMTTKASSVFAHKQLCKSEFSFDILARSANQVKLRMKECELITKMNPALNRREELLFAKTLFL